MTSRLATPADAKSIAAIYAPLVRETAISFEAEPPGGDEMMRRIAQTLPRWPWIVAEEGGTVIGYAYAGPHRSRAAYAWSVETSVYLEAEARGHGMGRRLYDVLLGLLRLQGFATAYAGIALPNEASLALHRAVGFEPVGVFHAVGFKHGAWHDVWWGARSLGSFSDAPALPRTLTEVGEDRVAMVLSETR